MNKHILIAAVVFGCKATEAPPAKTEAPAPTTTATAAAAPTPTPAGTRDYINIVGSSTVYPFSTVVAEQFGKTSQFKAPKVESTGSGGGLSP